MCGIFGIVAKQEQPLGEILVEAGRRLSYRGYDSVGCATLRDDGTVDLRKDVGKVEEVAARLRLAEMAGRRGIVQLRWATFGAPSQANAQPHLDSDGDLVGAHNGNVVNNVELRQQFIAEGMTVRSTNDGESCIHAVERYVDRGYGMVDAIRRAYQDLEGDYAFVIGRVGEDQLYAIKKGSGLVAGLAEGFTCVSSDLPSILPLTRRILRVQDGEIAVLWADRVELRRVADGGLITREAEVVTESMEVAAKGGYPHFMLKEIHEQPQVAGELIHLWGASPTSRRWSSVWQRRATCTWSAVAPASTPAWWARSTWPAWPAAPLSPSWPPSSSPSTDRRWGRRTWGCSSARAGRPRTCSMHLTWRGSGGWGCSGWSTSWVLR